MDIEKLMDIRDYIRQNWDTGRDLTVFETNAQVTWAVGDKVYIVPAEWVEVQTVETAAVEIAANLGLYAPDDPVNHPDHYNRGRIEVIDFITDQDLPYCLGNVVKYVSRYRYKNGLEDLKKAAWYLDKQIELLEEVCNDDTES